jgi:hypothetical protein
MFANESASLNFARVFLQKQVGLALERGSKSRRSLTYDEHLSNNPMFEQQVFTFPASC